MPRMRDRRGLADEIAKLSLCFSLSAHEKAIDMKGRRRKLSGTDVVGIKAGILSEGLRPGDEVEGDGILSRFAAIYHPRAYYPSYFLGEMRAELRRGQNAPLASPHYLPVSDPPPLPDGSRLAFLFPPEKDSFDRPDYPANVRDVLTRDYPRIPLVFPEADKPVEGRIRFKARLRQLSRASMEELVGVGERSYDTYSARGITQFLEPLETEATGELMPLRGSLFAEMSIPGEPGWDRVMGLLEDAICGTVEAVFPPCPRGERQEMGCYVPHTGFHVVRFRRRLFGLVFDPVIAVFRSPNLFGLYLPCDLLGDVEDSSSIFERFVQGFAGDIEAGLGLASPLAVEIAYNNRLPWAAARGALKGDAFRKVGEEHPFLEPTLDWLRG